ncbi:MAG: aldehyde dehydrogenase family protein, partial [Leptospira sp.]|nr:aldehyde dehydrogenase family protein [Leptospira sp.]
MAKTAVKKNKKTITRIKPQNTKSNGSHIKEKSSPLSKEIDRVFNLQKENRWTIAKTSAEERIRKLKDIRREILKYQTELHEAFRKDFRKPEAEVDLTEILPVISEINDAIKNIKKWMRPKRVTTPIILFGATSEIHYEPKGIVLIIGPWNYPFHLMIAPLVASIAAGNCSILKPSELTPNVSKIVHKMLSEIFTENEVFVLNGGVAETTALLEKPFDH